jgi:release factor glutamine methyltransferase
METQPAEKIEAPAARLSVVLRESARRLLESGIDSAALDAAVLLGHTLEFTREQLVLAADRIISPAQLRAYGCLVARRCAHEPTAYITGRREFWSLDIFVTPAVLIPRPETERVVEIVLELTGESRATGPLRILDIGTGSGAIAVALASELPRAKIFATDISGAALAVAAENAARNRVAEKIEFVRSDLFDRIPTDEPIDLIVSNPPYVCRGEIAALDPGVSRWEPRTALDGGTDGLDFYRRMAAQVFDRLRSNGAVVVEIGAGMAEAVRAIFKDGAGCAEVEIHKDYAGKERVVVAHKQL